MVGIADLTIQMEFSGKHGMLMTRNPEEKVVS